MIYTMNYKTNLSINICCMNKLPEKKKKQSLSQKACNMAGSENTSSVAREEWGKCVINVQGTKQSCRTHAQVGFLKAGP